MLYNSPFNKNVILNSDYEKFKQKGVVVFGTGNLGALCLHALKQKKIKTVCFVDNNISNWEKKFNDIDVISPEKLKSKYND